MSDTQHEFHRLHQVWARPFWVLEGPNGGHQVAFTPWQQNALMAKGLPIEAPVIGSLEPCPWDTRVTQQLHHLNRLHQWQDRLDKLQASGSAEVAAREMEQIQRDIRHAESDFICRQMEPVTDMAMSLVRGPNTRSEHEKEIIRVKPGMASKAADAWDRYLESGEFHLERDLTGIRR